MARERTSVILIDNWYFICLL